MRRWWGWLFLSWVWMSSALAQDVPNVLKDWQGWVLHDVPEHGCPLPSNTTSDSGARQCLWPGRLNLDVGKSGATFNLTVHVDAAGWLLLPGDDHAWPQQVNVNNKPATVLGREGTPGIWLEPGDYTVHGNLAWSERPAQLAVPASIGLVALSIDGIAVPDAERAGDRLTLGQASDDRRVADALSVNVYRRLRDGVPMTLETQVQLHVSGSAREQSMGPALPEGFVATSLKSDLPVHLENDGRLRIQLRPGDWTVTLAARASDAVQHVAMPKAGDPWPARETWSYADDPALRRSQASGEGTDAIQAGVPDGWEKLPAYILDKDNGLGIEQGARGNEGGKGEKLSLRRDMWLDFDGAGLTMSDYLTGELMDTQRLNVVSPWQLQRVQQDDSPLLVTEDAQGQQGVELRDKSLQLGAGLRVASYGGRLPASGWNAVFESISTSVHLPHGYLLLAAPGADRASGTWTSRWTLLDLFIVALIALLAGRWLGWIWTLPALGFLVLSQHQAGAPCWTVAVALLLALLWRALPGHGKLRQAVRIGASASLLLGIAWAIPFAADQMRYAMHPQLESASGKANAWVYAPADMDIAGNQKQMVLPPPPPPVPAAPMMEPQAELAPPPKPSVSQAKERRVADAAPDGAARKLEAVVVTGSRISSFSASTYEFDSRSVIQAGAGIPAWDVGNNYQLNWSGPVTVDQTVRLVILPSWGVRLLRVVMLLLLAAWLVRTVQSLWRCPRTMGGNGGAKAAAVAMTGLVAFSLLPHAAHAQTLPDQDMLDALRGRLTEAPKCAPACAEVAQAQIQGTGRQLSVDMEVHAGAVVGLALPHADDGVLLQSVTVDGHADAPLSRDDSAIWLRVERGVHRVTLRYDTGKLDTVTLHFAEKPQRVQLSGQGWTASGLDGEQLLGDSLTLSHPEDATSGTTATQAKAQAFPPFVIVTRSLRLDVDWTVHTSVERVAPDDGGFSLDLPLLSGEHPSGQDVRVHDGKIGVTFNAGEKEVSWDSRLDRSPVLTFEAPPLGQRAEEWDIEAAPILHVQAEGLPASQTDIGLRFQPLPGEHLKLTVSQPKAVAGQNVAFDSVSVNSRVGERATTVTLDLSVRSTRGGEHLIIVPQGASLLDAHRDGTSINLSIRDGKLGLPLLPDRHAYQISLRLPSGAAATMSTPAFDFQAPVANIETSLELPENRWLLWTWGPTDGPAVLYWSQLLVLLVVAWALARYAPTPLRFHQWLLLGLGFSALGWWSFAWVAAWLIVLGLRYKRLDPAAWRPWLFDTVQVLLLVFSAIALVVLVSAIPRGMLGTPDMHIDGGQSYTGHLRWTMDHTVGALPHAGVLNVPRWVYNAAMLAWSVWLANALIGWLRWAFAAWSQGGYWRKRVRHSPKQEEGTA